MALRMRNMTVNRATQENAVGIGKGKTVTTGLPKRAALGEISNVQSKLTSDKDAAEKKDFKKPLTTLATQKATGLIAPKRTTSRPAQQTTQSVMCKTTTLAKPSKVLVKPTSSNVEVTSRSTVIPPKPRPRTALGSTSSLIAKSALKSSFLPKSTFAPTRIKVPEIPENFAIRDIDRDSASNPILLGEYAPEIFAFLREIEKKFLVKDNFLKGQQITSKMRAIVVDWLVDVQLQYNLLAETLHLAVGIFDRFLENYKTINKQKLQLVGVTSMWIACKYEELFSPELDNFVYITAQAYTKNEMMKMEQLIHKTLDFRYGQPLSIHFLRRYSNASKADPKHHTYAKYFLELALLSYRLRSVRPSLTAAVALYISFSVVDENLSHEEIWTESLSFYSTYSYDDIKTYVPLLAQIILETKSSKLQAIQRKYSSSKQQKVSSYVHLKTEILEKLAALESEEGEEPITSTK